MIGWEYNLDVEKQKNAYRIFVEREMPWKAATWKDKGEIGG
jgi:hypothetical protein